MNIQQKEQYYNNQILKNIGAIEELTNIMWHKGDYKELEIQFHKYTDRHDLGGLLSIHNKLCKVLDELRGA